MRRNFYLKHKRVLSNFDGLLMQNPVLERGLILAPVVVASVNAKNSFVLGASFAIITIISVLISSFIPKKIPYTIRTILYTLIACMVFVPTGYLMSRMFVGCLDEIGVWLPLLCANSLIVVKSESRFHKQKVFHMLLDLVCNTLGFFIVIMLVGGIRELLSEGTLWGAEMFGGLTLVPAANFPFSGFIIVGLLAALVKWIKYRLEHPEESKGILPVEEKPAEKE